MTQAAVALVGQPDPFRKEGLGYVLDTPKYDMRMRLDYIRESRDELHGELAVFVRSTQKVVAQARINLSSITGRSTFVKHLDGRTKDTDLEAVPWATIIESFAISVLNSEREGQPFVTALNMTARDRPRDQIERLLPAGKPTIWYGPQGAGKGWLTISACVAVAHGVPLAGFKTQPGSVLYLDWEDDQDTFCERVYAAMAGLHLAHPDESRLHYRQMRGPFDRHINRVARYVADNQIGMVVMDSVGLAMGAMGDRNWGDAAIGFFESCGYLNPAAVLLIDHVTGEGAKETVTGKAIGSIYKMAEARCAWEFRKEQEVNATEQLIGLYHTKYNHTPQYPAIGVRLSFETADNGTPTQLTVARADLRESHALSKGMSVMERIAGVLRRGSMTRTMIAEELGHDPNAISSMLSKGAKDGRFRQLGDGSWGLADGPRERVARDYLRPVREDDDA